MTERAAADAGLERLLHVIPAASGEAGASLRRLAAELDTTPERILEDLEEVTARAYYHPGGWPDDISILVDADRVRVSHAVGLERPARLSTRETLCLALALRGGVSASLVRERHRRLALLRRAETYLGTGLPADEEPPVHAQDRLPDPWGVRETLMAAARDRHPCAVVYAKAHADDVDARVIHPYVVAHAERAWYVVGYCTVKEGMRIFRVDRILEAAEAEGTFDAPEDFDVGDWLTGGRVYRAGEELIARVRYSPAIARWVRERAESNGMSWTEESDGSVVIRHRVADPQWLVEHALQYGVDAQVLDPPSLVALIADVSRGMIG